MNGLRSAASDRPRVRDPALRQRTVLGETPRILPLSPEDIGAEGLDIVKRLQAAAGVTGRGAMPEVVATLLRHPLLYEAHVAIGVALLGQGMLSTRHRELAVLRTAWLCGAPFEWGEHVAIAHRAGIFAEEIERITQGGDADGWNNEDSAVIRAAEDLFADAAVSDRVWEALSGFLDEPQLIELVYVVGHYTKVAYLQNALRLRLTAGNPGLSAR